MPSEILTIREMKFSDATFIVDYFLNSDEEFRKGMGVDSTKLPTREEWLKILQDDYKLDNRHKNFFFLIWLLNNQPVGHCNINKIIFGKEAYMHLHMWRSEEREKGLGYQFLQRAIPYFFDRFQLTNLFCEPYALNPGPNKMLEKLGFKFIAQYETVPGWINFYQPVNRWCLSK